MGNIIQADHSAAQHDWVKNATFCGKPPATWNIPIMCSPVDGTDDTNETIAIQEFIQYASCCPPVANGTNIWQYRRGCSSTCYTYDLALAQGYNKCVGTISKSLGNGNGTLAVVGDCEYIDYAALMKQTTSGGEKSRGGPRIVVILGGVIAFAMMGVTSL